MGMCSTLVSMRVVDDPRVGQCFDTRGSVFFYNTFVLLHNVLWRSGCATGGHDVRESFEEAKLLALAFD